MLSMSCKFKIGSEMTSKVVNDHVVNFLQHDNLLTHRRAQTEEWFIRKIAISFSAVNRL